MVKARELVANEPPFSFVQDLGVNTASVSAVQDGTDAFADLPRSRSRACPRLAVQLINKRSIVVAHNKGVS